MTEQNERLTPMQLRERSQITQREVAANLNVTVGTVSSWERGVKQPHLNIFELRRLKDLYGCSLEELQEAFGSIQIEIALFDLIAILNHSDSSFEAVVEMLLNGGSK